MDGLRLKCGGKPNTVRRIMLDRYRKLIGFALVIVGLIIGKTFESDIKNLLGVKEPKIIKKNVNLDLSYQDKLYIVLCSHDLVSLNFNSPFTRILNNNSQLLSADSSSQKNNSLLIQSLKKDRSFDDVELRIHAQNKEYFVYISSHVCKDGINPYSNNYNIILKT